MCNNVIKYHVIWDLFESCWLQEVWRWTVYPVLWGDGSVLCCVGFVMTLYFVIYPQEAGRWTVHPVLWGSGQVLSQNPVWHHDHWQLLYAGTESLYSTDFWTAATKKVTIIYFRNIYIYHISWILAREKFSVLI